MTPEDAALCASRAILSAVRGPALPGGDAQLLARIHHIVSDAIAASSPSLRLELMPGQDAKIQQALAVIDAARLHKQERERAANDRRQGEERRALARLNGTE